MSFLNEDTPPVKDGFSLNGNQLEDESNTLKPDFESFDSRSLLSLLSQMQANLDQYSRILATLVDERQKGKCPFESDDQTVPFKRMKEDVIIERNVASMKANDSASKNAKCGAAQAAHFSATNVAKA